MIGVASQRALGIAGMTMSKIVIVARTTARIGSGISIAEPTEVVAETLRRIVAATPGRKWTITRSVRGMRGTRGTVTTRRKNAATSLPTQRGIDQATVCECTQVDDDYSNVCAFLDDAAPTANEADRADDRLLSARGRQRRSFGRCALSARSVVL